MMNVRDSVTKPFPSPPLRYRGRLIIHPRGIERLNARERPGCKGSRRQEAISRGSSSSNFLPVRLRPFILVAPREVTRPRFPDVERMKKTREPLKYHMGAGMEFKVSFLNSRRAILSKTMRLGFENNSLRIATRIKHASIEININSLARSLRALNGSCELCEYACNGKKINFLPGKRQGKKLVALMQRR